MKKIFAWISRFFARILALIAVVAAVLLLWPKPVFSPEYDVALGEQVVQSIASTEGPVLSREDYPEAYAHVDRLVAKLLASPAIQYRDLFAYDQVRIIHDDSVLNAFCTPGGFIYVYTGLIRYLEAEDHLAGVLGHEIAHAERRHSSVRMQKEYGAERLLELAILTTPISARDAWAVSMLSDLIGLDFSRDQEAEADSMSVRYLETTDYACDATAGFFEKLLATGQDAAIPAFLSDHPASDKRVADIRKEAKALDCSTTLGDQSQWRALQAALPPEVVSASEET